MAGAPLSPRELDLVRERLDAKRAEVAGEAAAAYDRERGQQMRHAIGERSIDFSRSRGQLDRYGKAGASEIASGESKIGDRERHPRGVGRNVNPQFARSCR